MSIISLVCELSVTLERLFHSLCRATRPATPARVPSETIFRTGSTLSPLISTGAAFSLEVTSLAGTL